MCDGTCVFFSYKAFFTILEHLKLKFSTDLFTDWANTKTIIPFSVGDQRLASHLYFGG